MQPAVINLVEPTLTTEAGHCYSFVSALCAAADARHAFRLWINRRAEVDLVDRRIEVHRHFSRRLRRPQSYLLYRRLLRSPGKVFIATAGRGDLLMLDWAAPGVIPPGKAYLYVHWFRSSEKKVAALRKIAARQPNLVILAPTPGVLAPFQAAGFRHAKVVPYPVATATAAPESDGFRHLLFAGAARQDKGFFHVVDLVAYLQANGLAIPVTLQISAEHFGKYDAATQADIRRLQGLAYAPLKLLPETLDAAAYAGQFAGAVCIQLYDPHDFADRVSGVTLDAFMAGSPIVTSEGTWMARMAARFAAGLAVRDTTPAAVLAAARSIISDYPAYQARARLAGQALRVENDAAALYRALHED